MTRLNRLRADALRACLALLDAELAGLPAQTANMVKGAVLDGGRETVEVGRDAGGAIELCVCAVTRTGRRKLARTCPETDLLLKSNAERDEIIGLLRNAALIDSRLDVHTFDDPAERGVADAIGNTTKQSLPGDFLTRQQQLADDASQGKSND